MEILSRFILFNIYNRVVKFPIYYHKVKYICQIYHITVEIKSNFPRNFSRILGPRLWPKFLSASKELQ